MKRIKFGADEHSQRIEGMLYMHSRGDLAKGDTQQLRTCWSNGMGREGWEEESVDESLLVMGRIGKEYG